MGIASAIPFLRPWRLDELSLLGKMSDGEVARLTGHSEYAVATKRRSLRLVNPGMKVRPWTAQEDALLGKARDAEVARTLGRSVAGVRYRRSKLHA